MDRGGCIPLGDRTRSADDIAALDRELRAVRKELARAVAAERRYAGLFVSAADGYALAEIIRDERDRPYDYRFHEVNPAFGRLFGIAPDEARGTTARELFPELDARLGEVLAALEATGEPVHVDYQRGPERRWVELSLFSPAPGQIANRARDISARKRAERGLREGKERSQRQLAELEGIYQSAPIGLAVLDARLRYRRVNARLAELNGLPVEAHLGKSVTQIVPTVAPKALPQVRRVLDSGEPILGFEVSGETLAQPGVRRDWVEHFWPIKSASGRVVGVNVVVEEITDRKRLEASRRAELEFRTLAENSADGIVRFDPDLRRVYANPAAARLCGLSREAMLGKRNDELGFPAEFATAYDGLLQAVLATGEQQQTELSLHRPEGETVIEARALPEFDAEGNLITILGIARDITERKRVEEALRASERKHRELVERLYEGIWRIDAEANTVFVNRRLTEMFGYEREEMLGRSLFSFMDAARADTARRNLALGREGRISSDYEFEFLRKDGTPILTRIATAPMFDDTGAYVGALAAVEDITAAKRAEEALRASEARLRQIMELAPSILYRVPLPGYRAEFISPEVERIVGFTREEWQNDPDVWYRQLHEEDRERVLAEMEEALRDADGYTQQYRLRHKNGRDVRWLEDRHRIERDADGRPVAVLGAIIDITDRKRAEEAVHQREQAFRALAERSPDIVARIGADLRFRYISPAVEPATGCAPAFFIGKTIAEVGLPRRYAAALTRSVGAAFETGAESRHEASLLSPQGRIQYFDSRLVPEFGADGGVHSVIVVSRDITRLRQIERQVKQQLVQLERANARLEKLSRSDALTGLANRRYLFEQLKTEWSREARHDRAVSLIVADIDYFKAFNDSLGHLAGDECLRRVAAALQGQIHRPADMLARYGGEEFVTVLPETPLSSAHRVAEAMRRAVEDMRLEHPASPIGPWVTVSFGVACAHPKSCSLEDLFASGDAALYRAKESGRNRVCAAAGSKRT